MTAFILICAILTGAYLVLMLLYFTGWTATPEFKLSEFLPQTKVAVIIAARNEEKNILNVLRDVLSQDYPSDKMEVIVVDDFSSDKTAERTKEISDSRVKLIQMKNEMSNEKYSSKKKSIETAVAKTNAELIVTTDADCRMNSNWLKSLVACYELKGKQFIMGAVKFHGEKNLFERMQSLDFLGYMGIACGSLFWRMPALCNGANLAYSRELFYKLNGFEGNEKIPSGDDMFLMTKAFQKNPSSVMYLKSTEATVSTHTVPTWKKFIEQRVRWGSKSKHYTDFKITSSLAIVFLFYHSIIAAAALSIVNCQLSIIFFFMIVAKCMIDFIFLFNVANFFNRRKLMLIFLPAQLFHITYVVIAGWLSQFKSYTWKNRINR